MARIREERVWALREKFSVVHKIPPRKFRGATVSVLLIVCLAAVLLTLLSTRAVNAGTVEAIGVGVYWDNGCSNAVSTIDWGFLTPGDAKDVTVYVRNEEIENVMLSVRTDNWNPSNAVDFMALSWNYAGNLIVPSEIVKVKLTLTISPDIRDITSFRFDITIEAQSTGGVVVPGDANGDGHADLIDLIILAQAWYTQPGDPNWDPRADFNNDNIVNLYDLSALARNWMT